MNLTCTLLDGVALLCTNSSSCWQFAIVRARVEGLVELGVAGSRRSHHIQQRMRVWRLLASSTR